MTGRARKLTSLKDIQEGEKLFYANSNEPEQNGYVVLSSFGREFAHTLCGKKFRITNGIEQGVKGFSGALWLSEGHFKSTL